MRYDLKMHPQDHLKGTVTMMKMVESKGQIMLNIFPLRTGRTPKYFGLHTTYVFGVPGLLSSQEKELTNLPTSETKVVGYVINILP